MCRRKYPLDQWQLFYIPLISCFGGRQRHDRTTIFEKHSQVFRKLKLGRNGRIYLMYKRGQEGWGGFPGRMLSDRIQHSRMDISGTDLPCGSCSWDRTIYLHQHFRLEDRDTKDGKLAGIRRNTQEHHVNDMMSNGHHCSAMFG